MVFASPNPQQQQQQQIPPTWLTSQNECNWDGLTCNNRGELSHIQWTVSTTPNPSLDTTTTTTTGQTSPPSSESSTTTIPNSDSPLSSTTTPNTLLHIGTLPVLEMQVGFGNSLQYLQMKQSLWRGVLPVLPQLQHLDLSQNLLNGPIQSQLAQMTNLRYIQLQRNQFVIESSTETTSVETPESEQGFLQKILPNLTKLETIDISQNFGLTGSLFSNNNEGEQSATPSSESFTSSLSSSKLHQIDIRSTGFTGTIPPQICQNAQQWIDDKNNNQEQEQTTTATTPSALIQVDCDKISCSCCCRQQQKDEHSPENRY